VYLSALLATLSSGVSGAQFPIGCCHGRHGHTDSLRCEASMSATLIIRIAASGLGLVALAYTDNQCKKPRGWLGRLILWNMNSRHSGVTDWGLAHVSIAPDDTILDAGCGGGRTLSKLAERATKGKVYGVDYSEASVAASKRTNARWIEMGRVEVRRASVSQLPGEWTGRAGRCGMDFSAAG
jgi:hypothetical protein